MDILHFSDIDVDKIDILPDSVVSNRYKITYDKKPLIIKLPVEKVPFGLNVTKCLESDDEKYSFNIFLNDEKYEGIKDKIRQIDDKIKKLYMIDDR